MEMPGFKDHYQVLIVGGGTAGLTVAAQLLSREDAPEVAIIEPSQKHYYQPIWTLVGAGVFKREISERDEADYIPHGAVWIQDAVATFDPDNNAVTTDGGKTIGYDFLVVAAGIQVDWDKVEGLSETLGKNGVCSNYSYDTVEYTWEAMRNVNPGGRALFTQPDTPIKCGGAPQKIMYLAADHFRQRGLLDRVDIQMMNPGTMIFGVPEFRRTLETVNARYGITWNFGHEIVAVDGAKQEAVIRVKVDGEVKEEKVEPFDMLHVTPPQSAPDFIKKSPLANAEGWVDVDQYTLQHTTYANVFSLGDACSTPNAKTGAAVRKQAPVVVHNLMTYREEHALDQPKTYHGYTSCPLVTGYGSLILAEFDYDNNPDPSFPFDTTQERYSMYALKLYGLPEMYWHGMLRGRM